MSLTLVIANKSYSSWSLRAWLALAEIGAPFEEVVIRLDEPTTHEEILVHSPAGRVPVLKDGPVVVWESLAILEYLAERFPDAGLWPAEAAARAHARALASEMHAGFTGLRGHYPMNLRRQIPGRAPTPAAAADIARIQELWRHARAAYGAGGPFLFGRFGAVDAMYAPVATRLATYEIALDPVSAAYRDAILGLPTMRRWIAEARAEPWIVPSDEVD